VKVTLKINLLKKGYNGMSKFDQAKMLMKMRKIQKELQKEIVRAEAGDGAVIVEVNGEMKIKT
jgi:DNA-binding protein YbaB